MYKCFFWIFFLSLFERPTYFWIPYIQTKISGTFSKILNRKKIFIAFSVKKSKSKGKQGKMFQKIYKLILDTCKILDKFLRARARATLICARARRYSSI